MKKIILFLLLTKTLIAEDFIRVHLVYVQGSNSVSNSEVREVFKLTKREFKNRLGLKLKRVSFKTIQNPYPSINTLNDRYTQFQVLENEVKNITTKKGEIVYFYMPPLIDGNKLYKAGKATKRCSLDTYNSYAVGWHKKNDTDRSVGLMLHELLHTLNASHYDDESVMSSYSPAGTNRYLNSLSIQEVKNCVYNKKN